MSKRVWKLQDFIAHSGRTHCARLGEKSGQVLATGGEDKRVNVWKVGKPHAMMSLPGHNSSVECLVFDKQEEVLVAGCAGGSIQVWNLEYRKMAGSLTGHRTACEWVECHPYGEFFASGSADTNLKIWDLRRKSCIQTYKGHTSSITSIRFSPHGRWVATGGQDSQVIIWDLTAGKRMRDLDLHKGPITSIAFHPKDYLLSTGSADRTAKLWSLETFQSIGSTELSSSPVQAVKFYEDGQLLSASQDCLRVYNTDNLGVATDTLDVDWKGLQDMRLCCPEEKLIAVYTEGPQLGVWVVDLQKRDAFERRGGSGGRSAPVPARPLVSSASGKSAGAPPTEAPPVRVGRENSAPRRVDRLQAESPSPDVQEETLRPISSSSERRQPGLRHQGHPPLPTYSDESGPALPPPRSSPSRQSPPSEHRVAQSPKAYAGVCSGGGTSPTAASSSSPPPVGVATTANSPYSPAPGGEPQVDRGVGGLLSAYPPDRPPGRQPPTDASHAHGAASPTGMGAVGSSAPPARSAAPSVVEAGGFGLEHPSRPQRPALHVPEFNVEQISRLEQEHPLMKSVLQRRLEQVRKLKELWAKGNLNSLSGVLQMPQDHGAACDFLRTVLRRKQEATVNLDASVMLLPVVRELMVSKYEDFVVCSVQFADALLSNIGDLVAETRRSCAKIPHRQLDFAREERLRKCDACYDHFKEIVRILPASDRTNQLRQSLHAFLQSC